MDKVSLAAILLIGVIVGIGVWQMSQSCAWSSTTKEDGPQGSTTETRCAQKYAAPPFVLLGIMAVAAVGIALAKLPLAWGGAISALAACTILGLSWGGVLFFHAVATVAIVALWHVSSPANKTSRFQPPIVAAILSIPLAVFGVFAVVMETPVLFDPCHQWNDGDGRTELSPTGDCRTVTSSGDVSRGEYAFQLATQHALAIVAGVLAVAGAWRQRGGLLLSAAIVWLVVTAAWTLGWGTPFIPFALLAGIACLVAAWRMRTPAEPGPPASSAP